MRRSFLKKVLASLAAAAGVERGVAQVRATGDDVKPVEVFSISELLNKQAQSGKAWLPFLKVPSLYCGVYVLEVGADDPQSPHENDEVYYVESGRGLIRVEGEDHPVEPGGVIFVKAGAAHHFHSIEDDLKLLVFFSSTQK